MINHYDRIVTEPIKRTIIKLPSGNYEFQDVKVSRLVDELLDLVPLDCEEWDPNSNEEDVAGCEK